MARPATTWARAAGERTDREAPDCTIDDCDPVAGLSGTIWTSGDDAIIARETFECANPEPECADEEGGGGGGLSLDAIMRPSIEWIQGYESRPQTSGLAELVNGSPAGRAS